MGIGVSGDWSEIKPVFHEVAGLSILAVPPLGTFVPARGTNVPNNGNVLRMGVECKQLWAQKLCRFRSS